MILMKLTQASKLIFGLTIAVLLVALIATAYVTVGKTYTVGGDFLASVDNNVTTTQDASVNSEMLFAEEPSISDSVNNVIDEALDSGMFNNHWIWIAMPIIVVVLVVVAIIIAYARKK